MALKPYNMRIVFRAHSHEEAEEVVKVLASKLKRGYFIYAEVMDAHPLPPEIEKQLNEALGNDDPQMQDVKVDDKLDDAQKALLAIAEKAKGSQPPTVN